MKNISSTAMSALVGALVCCFNPAVAMDDHTVLKPNDVKWGPGPASIPKGAQAAAIYGDASKEGLFALKGSSFRRGITYRHTRILSQKS